jgi:hypothetical protein
MADGGASDEELEKHCGMSARYVPLAILSLAFPGNIRCAGDKIASGT